MDRRPDTVKLDQVGGGERELRFPPRWWISSPTPENQRGTTTVMRDMCFKNFLRCNPSFECALTFAFCRTFPFVAMMETGLFFSAEAELTGEAASAPTLPFTGWEDVDDDDDDDDNDV